MRFEIGQKVVCVNVGDLGGKGQKLPPLRKGATYVVLGHKKCPCGYETIDIGIASSGTAVHYCNKCDRGVINDPIWWCATSRFAPIIDDEAEQAVSELLKSLNQTTVSN